MFRQGITMACLANASCAALLASTSYSGRADRVDTMLPGEAGAGGAHGELP